MRKNNAISEIIGSILLIAVIIAAFGVFGAIYLPTIKPNSIPQVHLSMACSSENEGDDIEYPCTRGSFNCHPTDPLDNKTCENDCKHRDYSQNPQYNPEDLEREILRCMENCMNPMCSDLTDCETLFICHNGGDTLDKRKINIIVDGESVDKSKIEIKQPNYTPNLTNETFGSGSSLIIRYPNEKRIDTVMVNYILPSGNEEILALNQFGTDVQHSS